RRVHRAGPAAHGLQLRAADRGAQPGLHPRHGRGAGSQDGRGLAVLGHLQPRRAARGDPLGRAVRGCGDGEATGRAGVLAARLGLPVPGRGTRPAGGGRALRGAAGSLRQDLLAELQGPRRLPHADAVERRRRRRLQRGRTVAAAAGCARCAQRRGAGARSRLGAQRGARLPALAQGAAGAGAGFDPLPRRARTAARVRARTRGPAAAGRVQPVRRCGGMARAGRHRAPGGARSGSGRVRRRPAAVPAARRHLRHAAMSIHATRAKQGGAMNYLAAILLLLLALPGLVHAEQVAEAKSPDGRIAVQLDLNGEGRLAYRVLRDGKPVVADSRLGFIFRNGRQLLRNLELEKQASRSFDETWEQPWGERRYVRDHYNELRASFVEKDQDHRRFDMVFRVFDDGVGFRYDVPAQPKLAEAQIVEELTEFAIARPATAWWIPAFEWNREEYLYNRTPLREVGVAQTPLTLRTDDGLHLSIHEAALVDY